MPVRPTALFNIGSRKVVVVHIIGVVRIEGKQLFDDLIFVSAAEIYGKQFLRNTSQRLDGLRRLG